MIILIITVLILDIIQHIAKKQFNIDTKSMKERQGRNRTGDENLFAYIAFFNFLLGLPFVLYIIIVYPSWITFGIIATQVLRYFIDNRIIRGLLDILYLVGIFLFAIIYYHG